jgi:hypothetical protein
MAARHYRLDYEYVDLSWTDNSNVQNYLHLAVIVAVLRAAGNPHTGYNVESAPCLAQRLPAAE